jgi:hypothetical protein
MTKNHIIKRISLNQTPKKGKSKPWKMNMKPVVQRFHDGDPAVTQPVVKLMNKFLKKK